MATFEAVDELPESILPFGIFSDVSNTSVNLFPNPVSHTATLEFEMQSNLNNIITIYDLTGRVIQTLQFDQVVGFNRVKINTESLNSGLYYLHIPGDNDEAVISTFVKE